MPTLISSRSATACALALFAVLCGAASAAAVTVPSDLRVLTTDGKVLADQRQYTTTTEVKTSPNAQCFGEGTGGSGRPARVQGANALGLLSDASQTDRDLRPLSVSDHFDFGLALCGIGGFVARDNASWYLKLNHKGSQLGGESVKLHKGDDVLWYLSPSFPYPDELSLVAPVRTEKGGLFTVRVFAYSDAGKRSPLAGATVTGADLPTNADGETTVRLTRSTILVARHGADIPDRAEVCVGAGCAPRSPLAIAGTARRDVIEGTTGDNKVSARGGRDRIDVRGGGSDVVDCGPGRDVVLLGDEDHARRCEVQSRR
jgi:hypothetical protein